MLANFQERAAAAKGLRETMTQALELLTAVLEASPKEARQLLILSGEEIEARMKKALGV